MSEILGRHHLKVDSKIVFNSVLFPLGMFFTHIEEHDIAAFLENSKFVIITEILCSLKLKT